MTCQSAALARRSVPLTSPLAVSFSAELTAT